MAEIAEGTSLISSVTSLFSKAIATAFPEITVAPAETLVCHFLRAYCSFVGGSEHQHQDEARLPVQCGYGTVQEAPGPAWKGECPQEPPRVRSEDHGQHAWFVPLSCSL